MPGSSQARPVAYVVGCMGLSPILQVMGYSPTLPHGMGHGPILQVMGYSPNLPHGWVTALSFK